MGINGARGGLSTPFILPIITCPPTRLAPVLPAETIASASPFLTIYIHFTKEESFFFLIAATGGSPVSITSLASTISNLSDEGYFSSSFFISSSLPTSFISISLFSLAAKTAPFTISPGALSPPMQSNAIIVFDIYSPPFTHNDNILKNPNKIKKHILKEKYCTCYMYSNIQYQNFLSHKNKTL